MARNKTHETSLMAHLHELKRRLIYVTLTLFIGVIVAYIFAQDIYNFLTLPLAEAYGNREGARLIYTGLTEAFGTYLRLSVFGGFIVAFPMIAYQLYAFVAPGLYRKERRVLAPVLIAGPALFLAGAAMAYYGIFPLAWKFFLSFQVIPGDGNLPIALEARMGEYLSLVMSLILAFGIAFQMPLVLTLLVYMGLMSANILRRGRRYAIVAILIVAAILTPPDDFSQMGLGIPLMILYEITILIAKYVESMREKNNA